MDHYIRRRASIIAKWALKHDATVREAGEHFGISKSTAHHDLRVVLPLVNEELALEVVDMIDRHKKERIQEANLVGRHIRNDARRNPM